MLVHKGIFISSTIRPKWFIGGLLQKQNFYMEIYFCLAVSDYCFKLCLLCCTPRFHSTLVTRSSTIAEGPRNALCQLNSCHLLHKYISSLFYGCILYADDIVLLSSSCYGLQKLLDICGNYGIEWDIKFNPVRALLVHSVG